MNIRTRKVFFLIVGFALLVVTVSVTVERLGNLQTPIIVFKQTVVVTATTLPESMRPTPLPYPTEAISGLGDKRVVGSCTNAGSLIPSFEAEAVRVKALLDSESVFNWRVAILVGVVFIVALAVVWYWLRSDLESGPDVMGCFFTVSFVVVIVAAVVAGAILNEEGSAHKRYILRIDDTGWYTQVSALIDREKYEIYILAPEDLGELVTMTIQGNAVTLEYRDAKQASRYQSFLFKEVKDLGPDWEVILVDHQDTTRILATSCQDEG